MPILEALRGQFNSYFKNVFGTTARRYIMDSTQFHAPDRGRVEKRPGTLQLENKEVSMKPKDLLVHLVKKKFSFDDLSEVENNDAEFARAFIAADRRLTGFQEGALLGQIGQARMEYLMPNQQYIGGQYGNNR
jgi:hypothetical protein